MNLQFFKSSKIGSFFWSSFLIRFLISMKEISLMITRKIKKHGFGPLLYSVKISLAQPVTECLCSNFVAITRVHDLTVTNI